MQAGSVISDGLFFVLIAATFNTGINMSMYGKVNIKVSTIKNTQKIESKSTTSKINMNTKPDTNMGMSVNMKTSMDIRIPQ